MRKYTIYQVDSFTKQLFTGNPAGVVLEADGLTDIEMQQIAREMNNSETAFVLSPAAADHDLWIRYFTPLTEVPLCGHATIAAHYVRAVKEQISTSSLLQKTGVGILPLEIKKDQEGYEIIMTQGDLEFSDPLRSQYRVELLAGLGLMEGDLDARCPVQIVSAGHSKVMIGVRARECLDSLEPDSEVLRRLSKAIGCNGYFVFTFDSSEGHLTHGRMFAPAIGIAEDPVTGNANGPLGGYLVHNKLVDHVDIGVFEFRGRQGEAMGRPGVVRVMVDIADGKPVRTRVAGRAVIVFETELVLE